MNLSIDRRILLGIAVLTLVLLGCTCAIPALQVGPTELPPTAEVTVVTATPAPTARAPERSSRTYTSQEQVVIDIYQRVSPGVVYIEVVNGQSLEDGGSGSGMVYDREGHVITNEHVIRGADTIRVYFSDDTIAEATVLGADPDADLAVLQVDVPPEVLVPLELGTSADLQVGQMAIAIGNPYGYERTLTVGHISALGRVLQQESQFSIAGVIQTDAAINPGNSGGPLLDSNGLVIGVNAYYRPSSPIGGSVGIGFAVPVDEVKLVIPALIAEGRYQHPWLGIRGYTIRPELVEALSLSVERGVLVAEAIDGGPADRAGLRGGRREADVPGYPEPVPAGGDVIIAIDNTAVGGMDDIITYLQRTHVGQTLTVTIVRDGEERTVEIELGARPES
ncbi:MAG TPA: trypsin-like peptidase domain-containing protein [Anaerolineae bacterium]|nr:trypsin-like peptidase domain-containing protein [Anaerolineae bacterium]